MTREEAIQILADLIDSPFLHTWEKQNKALHMAIEALSVPVVDITQRDLCEDISCTDCPFMQETCKLMDYVAYADRPHGAWYNRDSDGTWATVDFAYCSECKQPIIHKHASPLWHFCPNCGAKMIGGDDA